MEGIRHQQPDRPRLSPLHTRNISTVSTDSDSSISTPDREDVDDTDFFMTQANDSQSSLGMAVRESSSPIDQEREHRLTPISKLPPELLIAIFTKLTSTGDLRSCMLVCYNWALNTVGILWHRPLCNTWNNLTNVTGALNHPQMSFFPYQDLVRRLNLSALSSKINDGTVMPFKACKRVERLTLTNCSGLTDLGVKTMVEGNKHLQALDVTDLESLTDQTLLALADNCPRLQGLNITSCTLITDESLIAVSEHCMQLKRVSLYRPPHYRLSVANRYCSSNSTVSSAQQMRR
jgi:F-box and leucine-rich repeat protein GRR1